MKKLKLVLPFAAWVLTVFCTTLHAQEVSNDPAILDLPVQSESSWPAQDEAPLPADHLEALQADYGLRVLDAVPGPDHSLRSIWVRMFPLLSPPGGDPYPATHDTNHLNIHNDAGFTIYDLRTLQRLGSETSLALNFAQKTFAIGKTKESLRPLWITANGPSPMQLTWDKGSRQVGVRVGGGIVIEQTLANGKTHWSAVNVLDVEQYLQSVVASEAIPTWHPNALQVQAIAARTYGLRAVVQARAANQNYDLDPTTAYQSYRGIEFSAQSTHGWHPIAGPSTTLAVQQTSGQVLTYNKQLIQAYFSANSGGQTCTASECFGLSDLPYLVSKPDAPNIQAAPLGTWGTKANVSTASVRRALSSMGIKVRSAVREVLPLVTGPSGRVWQLKVQLAKGEISLNKDQTSHLMRLFGAIRSHLFNLGSTSHGRQHVVGHGYGHGVGMSQYGAQLLAQQGWTATQILKFYYVGTDLQNLTGAPPLP